MDQEATEFVKDTLHFELKTENNAHIFEVIQTYVVDSVQKIHNVLVVGHQKRILILNSSRTEIKIQIF